LGRYRDTKISAEYRNRIPLPCNRHAAAAAVATPGVMSATFLTLLLALSSTGDYEARCYADDGVSMLTLLATAPFVVNTQPVATLAQGGQALPRGFST
jgi:hypothetical protein